MRAEITGEFDLVLAWDDDGVSTITWSACSECEFEVRASILLESGLNYQGPTRIEFSTTCYAYSLRLFGESIDDFLSERSDHAEYIGSEDMQIRIARKRGECDYAGVEIIGCDLEYEPGRFLNGVFCDSKVLTTLGIMEDGDGAARAIRQVIEPMDATLDAPQNQRPPNPKDSF